MDVAVPANLACGARPEWTPSLAFVLLSGVIGLSLGIFGGGGSILAVPVLVLVTHARAGGSRGHVARDGRYHEPHRQLRPPSPRPGEAQGRLLLGGLSAS